MEPDVKRESVAPFVERRTNHSASPPSGLERRQFGNSYAGLSPDARELAEAIDRYKLLHRRRFVTCEELLEVIKQLGYQKTSPVSASPNMPQVG